MYSVPVVFLDPPSTNEPDGLNSVEKVTGVPWVGTQVVMIDPSTAEIRFPVSVKATDRPPSVSPS